MAEPCYLNEAEIELMKWLRPIEAQFSVDEIIRHFQSTQPEFHDDPRIPVYHVLAFMMWEGTLDRRSGYRTYHIRTIPREKRELNELREMMTHENMQTHPTGCPWMDEWIVTIEYGHMYWFHCRRCGFSAPVVLLNKFQLVQTAVTRLKLRHWLVKHPTEDSRFLEIVTAISDMKSLLYNQYTGKKANFIGAFNTI